jgi:hypothetical protein
MTDDVNGDKRAWKGEAGWAEYRRLILAELERMGRDIKAIQQTMTDVRIKDLSDLKTDIALLKLQAAMWGGLGGTVFGGLVTLAIKYMYK